MLLFFTFWCESDRRICRPLDNTLIAETKCVCVCNVALQTPVMFEQRGVLMLARHLSRFSYTLSGSVFYLPHLEKRTSSLLSFALKVRLNLMVTCVLW